MSDIVPDLYKKILRDFRSAVALDPWIKSFNKRLDAGKATQEDVQKYAGILGRTASKALNRGLTPENLPDGKIYWNIAKRTIEPLLREVTEMVNGAMVSIIEVQHKKKRIGIKPQRAKFNQDRCDAIINKIVNMSLGVVDEE
ncbi:MAG: hypothetical protein ACOYJI_02630 [Anaerovoracaceae bacterium]|jgi:hypothetical protein